MCRAARVYAPARVAFRKIEHVLAISSIADALGVFGELGCAFEVFAGAAAASPGTAFDRDQCNRGLIMYLR
jgi:hypothetical protein